MTSVSWQCKKACFQIITWSYHGQLSKTHSDSFMRVLMKCLLLSYNVPELLTKGLSVFLFFCISQEILNVSSSHFQGKCQHNKHDVLGDNFYYMHDILGDNFDYIMMCCEVQNDC